jgi:hypothetical protein
MIKLLEILKESLLAEYNKSQLDYISQKLNTPKDDKFISLMNALDSQGIKYPDIKDKILNNKIKSLEDLNQLRTVSKSSSEKTKKESGVNKLFENNHFLIIEPKTQDASCLYGAGTKWCTAAAEGNRFDDYTGPGNKLIYIIDKTKTNEDKMYKVAYHYEELKGSVMISDEPYKMAKAISHQCYIFDAKDKEYRSYSPVFKKFFKYMEGNGVPIENIFPTTKDYWTLIDKKLQPAYDEFIKNRKM